MTRSDRLVVFDLDGTLVDSSQDLADAGNALVASYGREPLPLEAIVGMVGDGARVLVQRLLAATGIEAPLDAALDLFLQLYDGRLLNTTRPYEGVIEMLEHVAASARLAVLTNKPQAATVRVLDGLGLSRFFAEVIGGGGGRPLKPDPAGLRALIEGAGVSPAEAVMVGDSAVDLRTAAAAGVRCCLVRYGFGCAQLTAAERAAATWIVDRPAQIVAVVPGPGTVPNP